ncbi:O-antigen ligase [Thiomicrorhabdus sp. 6S3-12]|uniref:O-antigen ligase family protein n=1 Tax=Thiomicrorhabdus sp. 6S3-12 TaxID=2819681 RepID=UPI001AAD58E2|nr:O-antigen ligase family protein [Thiomicrorhabdus sp. 6S3-12]MBO1923325.1 O-antigen ligase family protein [Thiomicrorhabdus sp. 6S3-12]
MNSDVLQNESRLFRLNQWLLLGLLLWAPLPQGSNSGWAAAFLIFWVCGVALIWSLDRLRTSSPLSLRSPAKVLGTLLALTQLWVALQWALGWSYDPAQHFEYLLLGISYSLFFILLLAHFYQRNALTKLIAVIVISGVFQAFYGTSMVLGAMDSLFYSKAYYLHDASGSFVNRNHLAGYLVMTISLGIGLMLAFRDGRAWNWRNFMALLVSSKMKIRLALVIMVIGLVMSHSRMGNTAFFVGLVIIGSLFIFTLREHRLRNSLLLISFVVIDLIIISQYFGLERLKERLLHTEISLTEQEGKMLVDINDLRSPIFQKSVALLKESPLVGIGAGSYETAFTPLAGPNFGGRVDHAHNDYLEFLIEYGLFGALPLMTFVLLSFWYGIKSLRNRRSYYRSGIGFGSSMAILGILIHSLTDFNLHIPANALTFMAVCAISLLSYTHLSPRRRRS